MLNDGSTKELIMMSTKIRMIIETILTVTDCEEGTVSIGLWFMVGESLNVCFILKMDVILSYKLFKLINLCYCILLYEFKRLRKVYSCQKGQLTSKN